MIYEERLRPSGFHHEIGFLYRKNYLDYARICGMPFHMNITVNLHKEITAAL